jgi:hypothetical protein
MTAVFAFALQAVLAITEAPAATGTSRRIRASAAAVMFFGLRPYPTAGRLRLAGMVAVALFLLGLSL